LPEREVSSQKLFFPVFRVSPAATHEKQDVSDRMPRLLNGPDTKQEALPVRTEL